MQAIELIEKELKLLVYPELGGALGALFYEGEPILRSTPELSDVRQSASYPLAPYSNRIGFCEFMWLDKNYRTKPNFDNGPHSLHGVAWQRAWQVDEQSQNHVRMHYIHSPDGNWPFAFKVSQHIALTEQTLSMQLQIENLEQKPQPVGLGWHPYFVRRQQSHLFACIRSRWDSDAVQLPITEIAQSELNAAIENMEYDNCFAGWSGVAEIRDEQFLIKLSADTEYLVVYTPKGKDYFCAEPVSHRNNAIQSENPSEYGLFSLAPRETFTKTMHISVCKNEGE